MAYNQSTPIIKYNGQDFHSLRDQCLSRGQLFEDDTFPPTLASIGPLLLKGENLSRLEWKRPHDLSKGAPYFILKGVSRFDIQQGMAGDCWFLAALGSLTQNPEYLQKILMEQSFSYNYAGIFRFRFWQCGQWVEVVVDDRLPILDRRYLFVNTRCDNQEFWPCLLEKAYAKLRGSYLNLHYGYLPDALVDLTGGVVTSIDVTSSPADMLVMVQAAAQAGSLITCATPAGPTGVATKLQNGLVSQHAYTVTGAEQVQYRRGWEDLIRLWNPWGNTEWKGPWKDGSVEWQESRDPRKDQLYQDKEDGEFWMSIQDFQDNFSCLYMCNKVPISVEDGNMVCARWSQKMFKGRVIPGSPADGFWRDTQFLFSVSDSIRGENTVVSFTIMPQDISKEDDKFPLSFDVFKVRAPFQHFQEKLPRTFFSQYRNIIKGIVSKTKCNLTKSFHLSPGTYVVAASARREPVEFLARIFLKMPVSNRSLDTNFNLKTMKVSVTSASLPGEDPRLVMFYKYSPQGLDMEPTELQKLLNHELLRGISGDLFSLDQCRGIVALMDVKVNGRLDPEEFSRLWSRLVHCQSVFQNFQRNSGVFLSSDLGRAIKSTEFLAGVSMHSDLLELMTLRYGDSSGTVTFPSLVCFLMRLEAMAKAFQKLSKDGKGVYLTEMLWLNLVMYS
ncbi:calpain-13 [Sorex fumeus]|uniref:calpain-13 n=1 Tax=Sorex fumeus TaxID=62283 RepID=UPI0024ACA9CF|nr:calpain-13 [Sorex fumeus]